MLTYILCCDVILFLRYCKACNTYFILYFDESESEFHKFKPGLKSTTNWFQLSAGLNLKNNFYIIFSKNNLRLKSMPLLKFFILFIFFIFHVAM